MEGTVYEVNRIKKTLATHILRCSDESLTFELQTALQYVRLRPFKYTLCRAVPLNINLLFTTASICISYVIVALQLTNFAA
uniref:Gustatory receptor n=1 Tax=Heliothis virescens TaxID=7102 RepID=A0A2A4JKG1_HELVI